jgi:hypothetical protein
LALRDVSLTDLRQAVFRSELDSRQGLPDAIVKLTGNPLPFGLLGIKQIQGKLPNLAL